jgi:catechol 2,3-dioxygenase-like lactoylglutathione lyase family enzyme
MQSVIPALRVVSWERSRAFYVDILGCAVDWEHRFGPDFPVFAQISRGGMTLYLSEHAGDCEVGGLVYLYVEDVDAWHREIIEKGFDTPFPQDQEFGLRDFRVHDPDGNQLDIATRL